ncbi:MAG: response regulator transcription factor [Nocardioides sp.]
MHEEWVEPRAIVIDDDPLPPRVGQRRTPAGPPVRVTVIDQHPLVVAGLAALLLRFPDRVEFVGSPDCSDVDVILYGVDDETVVGHEPRLHALLRSSSATVIAYGWEQDGPPALLAAGCGVFGFVHKQLPAEQLVDRIELLHHALGIDPRPDLPGDGECHPGVEASGLSRREIEVLSMIAAGETNLQIADCLCLSINSIKTYVRSTYRKIGVTRRSQAVLWASRHGLGPPARRGEVADARDFGPTP